MDAMKCISFTRAVNLPVLGLIENMSGYVCPCCGDISNVFSTGGGEELAKREILPFLGSLPVDTDLVTLLDAAEPEVPGHVKGVEDASGFELLRRYEATPSAKLFESILEKILRNLSGDHTHAEE